MKLLSPYFSGSYEPRSCTNDFLETLTQRVESKFFTMALDAQSQYKITESSADSLKFHSTNILTGINIGLNDISIKVDPESK